MTNAVFVVFLLGLVCLSGACTPTSRGINTFGPDCQYMCHCLNGILCDGVTGECSNGCEPGWFGPGCQFRDIAYKEVSRHNSNMVAYKYAPNGNDGNTKTCSYTNNASLSVTYPWWRVWLPRNETLHELTILTNDDGMGYFSNFTVTVEYVPESKRDNNEYEPSYRQICHQTTNKITESKQIHVLCVTPLVGNHLRIQLDLINAQLILCDVRVNRGRNVAFASSVTVSSRNNSDLYGPTNAVDGVLTNITWEFCFVSGDKKNNWILVDLGRFIYVTYVNITKFNDGALQDYILNVSNTSDSWYTVYNDTLNLPPTTQISLDITTRYIELRRPTQSRFIICELQIFGNCPSNKCGYECTEECHCKGLETLENKINGICATGCDSRWTGINGKCNKCANNTWGEACSNECGACKDSTCDVKTGKCPNGCQIGHYETDMCTQACDKGMWGHNCNTTCGKCLLGVCNAFRGSCDSGCASGYKKTTLCTEACQSKTWGINCNKTCGHCFHDLCNTSDGVCLSGCTSGYKNTTDCIEACEEGTWGYYCNNTCGNCSVGECNASDGGCESGCAIGYKVTPLCIEICDDGTYGSNCSGTCSVHCQDTCNKVDGTCIQCEPGWTGDLCQEECMGGRNGEGCKGTCSIHCRGSCNKVSGVCAVCDSGWTGYFCDKQCEFGMYGSNCINKCGFCQTNTICDKVTGICPSGCIGGFIGDTCEKEITQESTQQVIIITIAGSVVAGIVVICGTVIIIVCTLIKRTQSLRNTNQDHDEHINNPTSLSYEDLQLNCIQNDTEGTYESIGREEMSL